MCAQLLSHVRPFATPRTDCSPLGSSVHGVFQAGILEWVAISFSGDLPDPGIEPRSPALQADSLPTEPLEKPGNEIKHSSGALIFAAVTNELRVHHLM